MTPYLGGRWASVDSVCAGWSALQMANHQQSAVNCQGSPLVIYWMRAARREDFIQNVDQL
jgi:hypothetical protein